MGRIIKYGDYGAPTSRHRFFLFGTREKDAARFFDKLSAYSCSPKTVKDVIWNLRNKQKGEVPDHVWPELKTIDKYMKNYVEKKFGWYILKWNEPAPSFGNIMKTYILHPDSFNGRLTRVISVREALLIMGFDEAWEFPERVGLGAKYQMIVDAVRIQAKADPENVASWKALEEAGFKREGVLRKTFYCRGKWRDDCIYSVLREEWKEPRILKRAT
jgi:site-specific DNA-cytosine methylase